MAYDYSPEFLQRNVDLVRTLTKIAQSGEILTYESEVFQDIRARQYVVNNVLSSMTRNMVEYADIRTRLRCWTDHKHGKYTLYVGAPVSKLPGKAGPKDYQWTKLLGTTEAETYTFDQVIADSDQLKAFTGAVMNLTLYTHTARAELIPEYVGEEAVVYFNDSLNGIGWQASLDGNFIVLKRIA